MNFFVTCTKVFAFVILIFANSSLVNAQTDSVYRLPAGTRIQLRMDIEINSKVSSVNDTFTTTIVKPVFIRETLVLPQGVVVEGRITKVSPASVGGRSGIMEIRFETLRFGGGLKREIDAFPINQPKPESSRSFGLLSVIGGTAAGALIGAASKSGTGILIGAGLGAGAGAGAAFLRKGRDVRIKEDEKLVIELKKDVTLPVLDY